LCKAANQGLKNEAKIIRTPIVRNPKTIIWGLRAIQGVL
jgi:hypothetical protein